MPTPGGGPSRRSHTKSRKGCKTCKKRHIRCDEEFPQCKNCTKHQVRCDYMDSPTLPGEGSSSSQQIDLLWTPEISDAVDAWAATNAFPFPSLQVQTPLRWSNMSKIDLRLLYHLASIAHSLRSMRVSHMTAWVDLIPKFFNVSSSPLVLNSLLAFSATHIAWISQNTETKALSSQLSATALEGLREGIRHFTQSNADSILASLLLLGWCASDFQTWSSLCQSKAAVMQNMQAWRRSSVFDDILSPSTSNSANPDFSIPISAEARQSRVHTLQQVSIHLANMLPYLPPNEQEHGWIKQIQEYIHRISTSSTPYGAVDQFNHLLAIRDWLLWAPVQLLASHRRSSSTYLALSYVFAVPIAIESAFPTISAHLLTDLALRPLEEVVRVLETPSYDGAGSQDLSSHPLMTFPRETINNHRNLRAWASQGQSTNNTLPGYSQLPYNQSMTGNFGTLPSLSNYSRTLPVQGSSSNTAYTPGGLNPSPLQASPGNITPTMQNVPQSSYLDSPGSTGSVYGYNNMSHTSYAASPLSSRTTSTPSYNYTSQDGTSQSSGMYDNYGQTQSMPSLYSQYASGSTSSGFVHHSHNRPAVASWTAPRLQQHAYTYPTTTMPPTTHPGGGPQYTP